MILIPLILGISIVFGLLGRWLWIRTKTWPVPLRLLLITLVITPIVTPSFIGGEGGGIFVPVALALLDSIYNENGREFYEFVFKPLALVGIIVYLIAGSVIFVRHLVLRAKSHPVA